MMNDEEMKTIFGNIRCEVAKIYGFLEVNNDRCALFHVGSLYEKIRNLEVKYENHSQIKL